MQKPTTPVAEGFEWVEGPAGRVLVCTPLRRYATHAFTTRHLGFRGETTTADVRVLGEALSVSAEDVLRVQQVHGQVVVTVVPGQVFTAGLAADALVSTDSLRAIAVHVADCVPVLIADRGRRVVAAVHAGWRGTLANVTAATIEVIRDLGVPSADLVAAIGPSIGPCCYQVDAPVRDAFLAADPGAARWFAPDGPEHWTLDLPRANADALIAAGLSPESVHAAEFCTADHPAECFSYRRDGAGTGRMAAAITLRERGL